MSSHFTTTVVAISLTTFAVETIALAYDGVVGHGLPSALQMTASSGLASSTATPTTTFLVVGGLQHFGSGITEAVYPGAADSKVLNNDGQQQLPPTT